MSSKFLSNTKKGQVSTNSTTLISNENRILEEHVGDVSIVDLPNVDDYDLLHYHKHSVTESDISFRHNGVELVKAYKHLKQNLQFYQIKGTWVL
jgi:hypothetical protein